MTNATPLPLRHDTILGVCEAIGRDFGFNPLWLRLAFIAPLFVQPAATIAAYFLLGALVGGVNLLNPNRKAAVEAPTVDSTFAASNERLAIAA